MGRIRNAFSSLLIVLGLIPIFSCNEGVDGFLAESGSSVSITQPASTPTNVDILFLITYKVTRSSGDPGNGIQVQTFCQFCTFYDKAPGESILVLDLARLQQVTNPFIFKTEDQGLKQLAILMPAPANLGRSSYTDNITADIGVAQTNVSVSITQLATN